MKVRKGSLKRKKRKDKLSLSLSFVFLWKGELLEGKKHGKGKFTGFGGSIYEGNWFEGSPEGYGTLELNNDKEATWI